MPSSRNRARFSPGRAEFERRDIGVGVTTEIGVSPEDAIEIRHLMLYQLLEPTAAHRGDQLR